MKVQEIKDMFIYVSKEIVEHEDMLTEIDLKIGDGDHGIGMTIGFKAVKKVLEETEFLSVNELFKAIGFTLLAEMGGASGVLFGTIFISGIVQYPIKEEFDLMDFANVFNTGLDSLKERGKAKVGDKTMIDALEPAVYSLLNSYENGRTIEEGFVLSSQAALEGVESTKEMAARFGRAKYFREKSIGFQDAGATSVYLIFKSMADWISR